MRVTGMLVLVVAALGMCALAFKSPERQHTAAMAAPRAFGPLSPAAARQTSAKLEQAKATREQRRQTPAARRERAASRTVHSGISASQVRRLVRAEFPDLVKAPASTTERLKAAGAKLERFQTPDRAVVRMGRRRAIVASISPLAVDERPVDPALTRTGNVFAPRQALTEYEVPVHASGYR